MTYEHKLPQTADMENICSTWTFPLIEAVDDISLYSWLKNFQRTEDSRSLNNYENIWADVKKWLQGFFIKPKDEVKSYTAILSYPKVPLTWGYSCLSSP